MPESERCPKGRSQLLTSELGDKVVIDRKTFKQLRSLIWHCEASVEYSRNSDIFLTSLDTYLSECENPEAKKSVMLLKVYRDTVPEALEEAAGWIEEARELTDTILAASHLGGSDE